MHSSLITARVNFNLLIRRIPSRCEIEFTCHSISEIKVNFKSEEDHWRNLRRRWIEICEKENNKLKLSNCVLGQTNNIYLDQEIDQSRRIQMMLILKLLQNYR